jgi:hypothetical protein
MGLPFLCTFLPVFVILQGHGGQVLNLDIGIKRRLNNGANSKTSKYNGLLPK